MNSCQSGGAGDKSNDLKIFPLRNEDLVFSKNSDGILSCGYKVSNALLNATLSMPMVGGGGGGGGGGKGKKHEKQDNEPKTAKLMEDLVIPSSLYYGKPVSGNKVFNYKKGKRDKDKKGRDSSSDNESDDDVIEESIYDKLLSLVSLDNKIKYNKKTRKNTDGHAKINTKKDGKIVNIEDDNKNKTKNKNKKTKKVRFAV